MPVPLVTVAAKTENLLRDPIKGRVGVISVDQPHSTAIIARPLIRVDLFHSHKTSPYLSLPYGEYDTIEGSMEADKKPERFSMKLRCLHLGLLNVIDGILTLIALMSIPDASEANPLWASVIAICPWFFLVCKISLGSYLISLLYRCRTRSIRKFGSAICIAAYWGILIQNSLLVLAVKTDMFL